MYSLHEQLPITEQFTFYTKSSLIRNYYFKHFIAQIVKIIFIFKLDLIKHIYIRLTYVYW